MDGVLMGMLTPLGDLVGHVMHRNDGVEQRYDDKDLKAKRKIIEEHLPSAVATAGPPSTCSRGSSR